MFVVVDIIEQNIIGKFNSLNKALICICEHCIIYYGDMFGTSLDVFYLSQEYEIFQEENKEHIKMPISDEEFRKKMKNKQLLRNLKIEELLCT